MTSLFSHIERHTDQFPLQYIVGCNCMLCRAKGQFCAVRQATVCWTAAVVITAAYCCGLQAIAKCYWFIVSKISNHFLVFLRHCWTVLYTAELYCTLLNCAVHCWTVLYTAELYSTLLNSTVHCWTVLYIAELYCTLLNCTVHCWTVLYIA